VDMDTHGYIHVWILDLGHAVALQNLSSDTQPPAIIVDGNTVNSVDNFIYLDSGSLYFL